MKKNEHISDDVKTTSKQSLNKYDYDLYHDEKNTIEKIIRVKRIKTSKEDKWKVFENTNLLFIIESNKLSKKAYDELLTPIGLSNLIKFVKSGLTNLEEVLLKLNL